MLRSSSISSNNNRMSKEDGVGRQVQQQQQVDQDLGRHRDLQDMMMDDGDNVLETTAGGTSSGGGGGSSSTNSTAAADNDASNNANNRDPILIEKDNAPRPIEDSSILSTPEVAGQTGVNNRPGLGGSVVSGSGSGSGSSQNTLNDGGERFSYFPDQVAHISYVIALKSPPTDIDGGDAGVIGYSNDTDNINSQISRTNSEHTARYLDDLTKGMDILATRIAPEYFNSSIMTVREVTASVDGFFITGKRSRS
jgi:hypothetical protein